MRNSLAYNKLLSYESESFMAEQDQDVKFTLFDEDEEHFVEELCEKGIVTQADARKLKVLISSGQTQQSVIQLIMNLGMASERDLLSHLSSSLNLKIIDQEAYPTILYGETCFNRNFLRKQNLVVISETDKLIEICINDPFSPDLNSAISFGIGRKLLKVRLGYRKDINEALDLILKIGNDKQFSDKLDAGDEILLEKDIRQLEELASEAPVIKIVNTVIKAAIEDSASDIHVEPHADLLKVRNRIDGVLVLAREIPINLSAAVVSRIKILSSLDIAQRRAPQDGRFDINIEGQDIDIRVSVIPTIHGESIVLRLLYKKSISFDFDSLGYAENNAHKIMQMLDKPHGLLLVTGPTGSGKSTTLYAMLQKINSSEKKIVSVEDPVEYKVEGVNQIQVNPEIGVSFASALSAIVRHDPEVIMVGEMRDSETAQIAVRASMTGHLVLTTLHTNSAASSIERLIDLGVEKSFVFSSLIGVIAQRLVRRLCNHCKQPVGAENILLESGEISGENMGLENAYQAKGCDQCNQTGYKGRLSISEVMLLNDDFRSAALKGTDNIQQLARSFGMESMVMDGFDKIRSGQTTVEELFRVVLE
ncbi:MAG: type II/IV secretion system protein [Gammaproteobacteria bacterium]|nr:type II/IV secretion system protein [Gammaproteobacteria bacterium]